MYADLVAVEGDPLANIGCRPHGELLMKNGLVFKRTA